MFVGEGSSGVLRHAFHPFSLTASVLKFTRRAHALTFLARLSKLLTLNYNDDHFGVTKESLSQHECAMVLEVCTLLGVQINAKTQQGSVVGLFGVTYKFKEGLLMVTEMRSIAITFEIIGSLQPGAAAKLRGRLGLVASHLSGRHGRPFFLALSLSGRQCSRAGTAEVTAPFRRALKMWLLHLHKNNTPRVLYGRPDPRPADVLLFSDGFVPDPRPWVKDEWLAPRVGWTSFARGSRGRGEMACYSSFTVPEITMQEWLPRRTQIVLVELFAAVLALCP